MSKEIKEAKNFIRKNPSQFEYVNKNCQPFWNWDIDQADDNSIELAKEWDKMYELAGIKEENKQLLK